MERWFKQFVHHPTVCTGLANMGLQVPRTSGLDAPIMELTGGIVRSSVGHHAANHIKVTREKSSRFGSIRLLSTSHLVQWIDLSVRRSHTLDSLN